VKKHLREQAGRVFTIQGHLHTDTANWIERNAQLIVIELRDTVSYTNLLFYTNTSSIVLEMIVWYSFNYISSQPTICIRSKFHSSPDSFLKLYFLASSRTRYSKYLKSSSLCRGTFHLKNLMYFLSYWLEFSVSTGDWDEEGPSNPCKHGKTDIKTMMMMMVVCIFKYRWPMFW